MRDRLVILAIQERREVVVERVSEGEWLKPRYKGIGLATRCKHPQTKFIAPRNAPEFVIATKGTTRKRATTYIALTAPFDWTASVCPNAHRFGK
jgi:hypothetical protein